MNASIVENILAQPDSLRAVVNHQYGDGRGAMQAAGELLRSSKHIVLSGMGASLHACIPLASYFASRRIAAPVVETSELLHFDAGMLTAETTVVLVSRSGESVEATKLLPVLQERGCSVIGVVNVADSTLARQSTHTILMNSFADELVAIQTYTASLAALAVLGASYAEELDGDVKAELDKAIVMLSRWVPACFRFSGSWPGFFAHGVPLYLLGRGPSLAAVHAGALLLQEVARMPAIAMSSAQFRHGPVEVVNDRFRAVVFGSQPATEALDATLAASIVQMEGNVRWIGPATSYSGIVPLCDWPADIPSRFIPLFEVIPMQMAAYHLARWHGITPGKFKFATPVTLSEQDFAPAAAAHS